jgi:hypothetical protein
MGEAGDRQGRDQRGMARETGEQSSSPAEEKMLLWTGLWWKAQGRDNFIWLRNFKNDSLGQNMEKRSYNFSDNRCTFHHSLENFD